jgi:voltage-gated potassium channel
MTAGKRYLFLMIALIASLFFSTFRQPWADLVVSLFFLLSLIAAAYAISRNRRQLLILLGLSGAVVLPIWQIFVPDPKVADILYATLWGILTFYVGLMIFRDILKSKPIGLNEVYGAVAVYLLIGIFFGMLYQVLLAFDPNALYFNPANFSNQAPVAGEIFYFSFVTLSTVGYGDVSPIAPLARSLSMIEAILGVMYVATMIARFIAIHTNSEA